MKCAAAGCEREVKKQQQKYCSEYCAPLGGMSESGTRAPLENWDRLRNGRPRKNSDDENIIEITATRSVRTAEPITQKTQSDIQNSGENNMQQSQIAKDVSFPKHGWNEDVLKAKAQNEFGESGTAKTENNILGLNTTEELGETQPVVLQELPIDLNVARSRSMSLLDSTMTELHDCMKSVAKDQDKLRDFRTVNAVANLGKQIAMLARVKLDAIKEWNK